MGELSPGHRIAILRLDAEDRTAYMRNAQEDVRRLRSYVYEVLVGTNDEHVRSKMLFLLDGIEHSIEKALI
jgi:hypothetical protein